MEAGLVIEVIVHYPNGVKGEYFEYIPLEIFVRHPYEVRGLELHR